MKKVDKKKGKEKEFSKKFIHITKNRNKMNT